MLAKLMSVGFLLPMTMSLVLHTPVLSPFSKKKKKEKKVEINYGQ